MQNKHDEGFSLIEILVAIVILAAFVVPICGALLMSNEMNTRTDNLMQAQLAVSSAVEILMAEGIPAETPETNDYGATTKVVVETKPNNQEAETPTGETEGTTDETEGDTGETQDVTVTTDRFPNVTIKVVPDQDGKPWFSVTVTSSDGRIEVQTFVKAVKSGEVANEKT
jgi:prepilin-type N-terminal cleavage/methylation domain-containing protein